MQIATNVRNVESNIVDSRQFQIEMNPKAFAVLSSNIYTDKPLAIVREISCNAMDANPKRPFTIAAPSSSNPHLLIRDYGPGLSDDDVLVLYTTFFRSTKSHNNDAIGGLGLGSKSPLSYTDMFTVRSFQGGRVRTFIIFKNQDGVPEVTAQDIAETNEDDGLEVRIPVKGEDFHRFSVAIQNTLKHFPKDSFKVFGTTVKQPTFTVDKGEWAIYQTLEGNVPLSVVKMGPVAYRLDWTKVFGEAAVRPNYNYGYHNRQSEKYPERGLELRFNIGELDIAPSREELSYDKQTIDRLKQRYEKLVKEIRDDIKAREGAAKSRWELSTVRQKIRDDMSNLWGLADMPSDYGRHTIESTGGRTFERITTNQMRKVSPEREEIKACYYHGGGQRYQLIWNDMEKSPRVIARLKLRDNGNHNTEYLIFDAQKWANRDACSLDLGGVPDSAWINLSSLPVPEIARKSAPSGESIVFTFNRHYNTYDNKSSRWNLDRWRNWETTTTTVCYLPMKGANCDLEGWENLIKSPLVDKNLKLIGIPRKIRDENQLPGNFVPLQDYLDKKVEELMAAYPETARHLAAMAELSRVSDANWGYRPLVTMARAKPAYHDPLWLEFEKRVEQLFDYDRSKVADDDQTSVIRHHRTLDLPSVPNLVEPLERMMKDRPAMRIALPLFGSVEKADYALALRMLNVT